MRALLRVVVSALIVLLAFEGTVRHIAPRMPDAAAWPTPETELKSRQIETLSGRPQIVFVGTSVTEAAIDPDLLDRFLGTSSYNAAIPFSTPLSTKEWVDRKVLPELKPDVLVIGILETTIAIGKDVLIGPLSNSLSYDASASWWQTSSLIARRRQLRHPEQTLERMRIVDSGLWTPAGHQTAYYHRSLSVDEEAEAIAEGVADESMLVAIRSMVERARQTGAVPVLLLEPGGCPPIYQTCADTGAIHEQIMSIAREEKTPVIDGGSIEWPVRYYADSSHFNKEGTTAFSAFVAEELRGIAGASASNPDVNQ